MAGDWIKMRGNLWDDPRVAAICDATEQSEAAVVGALYWLWATADQHTEDGCMPGLTLRQIDRKTGVQGFAAALVQIGWLADDPQGVVIRNFEEHNGASAKKRCQTAKRVASHRSDNADVTPQALQAEPVDVTDALAREEKRRELHKEAKASSSLGATKRPSVPCPYEAIVEAYHSALPMLPRVRVMDEKRKTAMRKRWAWVLSSSKADGTARATNGDEALAWFAAFFDRAGHSGWLTGRTPGRGHEGWTADLDFLMTDRGLKAVVERTEVAA
jgi:hypothetical protein